MFTVTITYLLDGQPETVEYKNVQWIYIDYSFTRLLDKDNGEILDYYYVIDVKAKLNMQT